MEPVSARLPGDLYLWLASLEMEGAPTNSDKVRELLAQVKRQYDGAFDYAAAHAWVRDLLRRLTEGLVAAELESGKHSELLAGLLEHVTALLALVVSARPTNAAEAGRLEDALVRRVFSMANTVLRQAATTQAAAFDPEVARRHAGPTLELADLLNQKQGAHHG
jgi:hypothetical protein